MTDKYPIVLRLNYLIDVLDCAPANGVTVKEATVKALIEVQNLIARLEGRIDAQHAHEPEPQPAPEVTPAAPEMPALYSGPAQIYSATNGIHIDAYLPGVKAGQMVEIVVRYPARQ